MSTQPVIQLRSYMDQINTIMVIYKIIQLFNYDKHSVLGTGINGYKGPYLWLKTVPVSLSPVTSVYSVTILHRQSVSVLIHSHEKVLQ